MGRGWIFVVSAFAVGLWAFPAAWAEKEKKQPEKPATAVVKSIDEAACLTCDERPPHQLVEQDDDPHQRDHAQKNGG